MSDGLVGVECKFCTLATSLGISSYVFLFLKKKKKKKLRVLSFLLFSSYFASYYIFKRNIIYITIL